MTRLAASATVLAVAVTLVPGTAHAAGTAWWPTSGYTVTNSGHNPNENVVTTATVKNLTVKRTVGSAYGGELRAPVIDGGLVFVPNPYAIDAFDDATGAHLWRFDANYVYPGATVTHLVARDGQLVASFQVEDPMIAYVMVIDPATGNTVRRIGHLGRADTLLVDRGIVFVSSGVADPRAYVQSAAHRISDGLPLWEAATVGTSHPVSANGRVLLRGWRDNAQVSEIRDLTTGAVVWSGQHTWYDALAADLAGTKFYVAWGHSLQIIDATTGTAKWLASNVNATQASVTPTRLYITTKDNKVSAVNAATDAPAFWTLTFIGAPSKPVIAGGLIYVAVAGDRIHTREAAGGAELAAPRFTGMTFPPVITNGTVYTSNGHDLHWYKL